MSGLVGNPEDRFSRVAAQFINSIEKNFLISDQLQSLGMTPVIHCVLEGLAKNLCFHTVP